METTSVYLMIKFTIVLLMCIYAPIVGCGSGEHQPTPDYMIEGGIGIKIESGSADWTIDPQFNERIIFIIASTAEYVGHDVGDINGWVIYFRSASYVDGRSKYAMGTTHHDISTIEVATKYTDCIEESILIHELIHAYISDNNCHNAEIWTGDSLSNIAIILQASQYRWQRQCNDIITSRPWIGHTCTD